MRDHEPLKIPKFNGLWKRGDAESVPIDHSPDCENIKFIESGIQTRDGIDVHMVDEGDCLNLSNIVRIYTYLRPDRQSLLALDTDGNIYDTTGPTPCTPILTIAGMTDFSFVAIAGRAYITPHDGVLGLQGEFVYVYLGYGAPARKAAGTAPTGTITVVNGSTTSVKLQAGVHIFGVVFETDTGFLTQIGGNVAFTATGAHMASLSTIPISPDSFVIKRHIVASKTINAADFSGDVNAYQLFFVPNGTINDNTTTVLADVDFYDSELIEDASYLEDVLEEIPAGVFITTYHNRLVVGGFYGAANSDPDLDTSRDISLARVSVTGEPENFDGADGIIIAPIDGAPLTNAQEYRDILYLFKQTKTHAYVDNEDVPSTWVPNTIDQGRGTSPHGIATVLDSGGINIEFIIVCGLNGVALFNGSYSDTELSWKIEDYWLAFDKDDFHLIQVVNDTIGKRLFIVTPELKLLYANTSNGLNAKDIRWGPWVADIYINTVALINVSELIIGSQGLRP